MYRAGQAWPIQTNNSMKFLRKSMRSLRGPHEILKEIYEFLEESRKSLSKSVKSLLDPHEIPKEIFA